jgi:hypothetical protein
MLHIEHTKITRQLIKAKRQLREQVTRVKDLEDRLQNVISSEAYLINGHQPQ